jgi:hypothetical protein
MTSLTPINELIGLLIRQNSMLANRFREQLVQIKDTYKRGLKSMIMR